MARQGQFQKGNKAAVGRGPNKITKTVKETVLAVFIEIQDDPIVNLTAFAKEYPKEFYNIAAKLIPTEVQGTIDATITTFTFQLDEQYNQSNASI